MIAKFAQRLSDTVIALGVGREEDRDIYVYGLDIILSTVVNVLCAIALGMIFRRLYETIVYLAFFVGLRHFAGGYHADTHLNCLIVMLTALGLSILFLYAIPLTFYLWISVTMIVLSASLIFIFAPVEHPNRPIRCEERKRFKKCSRATFIVEVMLILGGYWLLSDIVTLCMAATLGMMTSALSLGAAVIINHKRMVLPYEKTHDAYSDSHRDDD